MKSVGILFLLVLSFVAIAESQKKKSEPALPTMIVRAKWVMVTTMQGSQYDRNVLPEDRRAIADLQDRIQKWGRYALAYKPEDADLLLVVRRGRVTSVTGGMGVSIGSDHRPGVGPVAGNEIGPKDDMLAVYDAHSGIDQPPLWRKLQSDGLVDNMPLFQDFKKAVETGKP